MTANLFLNKVQARKELKCLRAAICQERRKKSEVDFLDYFTSDAFSGLPFLSFSSFADEICTHALNHHLAQSGRLILPKVSGKKLELFWVDSPKTQLSVGAFGILEPLESRCRRALPSEVKIALIPGLGFDTFGHRIGYGGGFYDRFLSEIANGCHTIGVGFKEQFNQELPTDSHDIALNKYYLF